MIGFGRHNVRCDGCHGSLEMILVLNTEFVKHYTTAPDAFD